MPAPTNPFVVSGYAGDAYFCDREDTLKRLMELARDGAPGTIISLRRMGKTALLEHLFAQLERKRGYLCIRADIYATTSVADLNRVVSTAMVQSMHQGTRKLRSMILNVAASIRASISYSPYTGEPKLELSAGTARQAEQTLDQILRTLDRMDQRVVVAIDEFQQVQQYTDGSAEALLRTLMQKYRNVCFLFAGSRKDMLVPMFSDYKRPFYHSTQMIYLEQIPYDRYRAFIAGHFRATGRSINEEAIRTIYDVSSGHTHYVQLLSRRLWESGNKKIIGDQPVYATLYALCKEMEPEFAQLRTLLAPQQWSVLLAVATDGIVARPTSKEFLLRHGLGSASTVQKSIRALIGLELVYLDAANEVVIYNPFFGWWARYMRT